MQLMTDMLGGKVDSATSREFGHAVIRRIGNGATRVLDGMPEQLRVWASHGDFVASQPPGFQVTATSANAPISAMEAPGSRLVRAAVPS